MPKPRAWLCFSSGKDSAWALHVARRQADVEVVGLLSTLTEPYDRVSMHGVRRELLTAQAAATGLPLIEVLIPFPCPNEAYEAAMRKAINRARADGITEMIFGDLFLEDIREYRRGQLAGTGIAARFPLWGLETGQLARDMIAGGLVAYITCLDPKRVPRELAGAKYDESLLDRLGPGVDPCAENGEFHTCVTAGPMFSRPIAVELGETVERDGFVFTDLLLT